MGGSGSGKSTITKLLLKYYDPEDGEIDINGANLAEYTNSSVRRAIAYVPQNIELFSKTIYDNIRISRMDATLDEVKEAAKKPMPTSLSVTCRCSTTPIWRKPATACPAVRSSVSHWHAPS